MKQPVPLTFLWLEITGRCQHCYASSGPAGTHGTMSSQDWTRVIDQAAALGVSMVQFIGGEPTLHSDLPLLIRHTLARGIAVEVFSNLAHVTEKLWKAFSAAGVQLATSYYSPEAEEHDAITGRRGSHDKTLANIREAVNRSIPLRVGVIGIRDRQQVAPAVAELTALGIADVGVDYLRQVGRGVRDTGPGVGQLCGNCANGTLAISPQGDVWPCVFTRWIVVGNVGHSSLEEIHGGPTAAAARAELNEAFAQRPSVDCRPICNPNCAPCDPAQCRPSCQPSCNPTCSPTCSPSCSPVSCSPRRCWPEFE